jgi:hypothetical protein
MPAHHRQTKCRCQVKLSAENTTPVPGNRFDTRSGVIVMKYRTGAEA